MSFFGGEPERPNPQRMAHLTLGCSIIQYSRDARHMSLHLPARPSSVEQPMGNSIEARRVAFRGRACVGVAVRNPTALQRPSSGRCSSGRWASSSGPRAPSGKPPGRRWGPTADSTSSTLGRRQRSRMPAPLAGSRAPTSRKHQRPHQRLRTPVRRATRARTGSSSSALLRRSRRGRRAVQHIALGRRHSQGAHAGAWIWHRSSALLCAARTPPEALPPPHQVVGHAVRHPLYTLHGGACRRQTRTRGAPESVPRFGVHLGFRLLMEGPSTRIPLFRLGVFVAQRGIWPIGYKESCACRRIGKANPYGHDQCMRDAENSADRAGKTHITHQIWLKMRHRNGHNVGQFWSRTAPEQVGTSRVGDPTEFDRHDAPEPRPMPSRIGHSCPVRWGAKARSTPTC